jgi:undecaprenyl-diphosphatase
MIDTIASHILGLPAWVALLVVFAVPALESSAFIGFVFPGEIALILGGVLASEARISLLAILAAGIGGAIVGDSVGYLVGRRYGRGLLEGTLGRLVNHKHFDRAESYLAERGGKAVFLGRFTAALRVMIPGLAGMSRMHYPKFVAFNVAGGLAWGTLCVMLGYVAGGSWRHVERLASHIGLAALGVIVVLVAGTVLLRKTRGEWTRDQLQRLRSSGPVVRITHRFPSQTSWLAGRLDPRSPTGLWLTLVVAAGTAGTWAFLGITQDVRAHEEMALVDPRLHAWLLPHRVAWLDQVMRAATWLGANAVLMPMLLVVVVVLARVRRSWAPVLTIVPLYFAALVLHALVQQAVHRPRPPVADWLSGASGWSYPSGHTIQATVAWGIVCLLLAEGRGPRVRAALMGVASAVVLLVAASRVYLGVHWLTDVLASLSLGVALLSVYLVVRLSALGASSEPAPATDGVVRTERR